MSGTQPKPNEDLSLRIARFADLKPLALQQDPTIPQAALDIMYARQLLSVIGRDDGGETALTTSAPIRGAAGVTMTLAICPPGQGPELHSHKATYETFTVLQGEFEFRWGDNGEHSVRLGRFDTISVPPGIARAFRNVGEGEAIVQVIISGGVHDAFDVESPPQVGAAVKAASPALFERLSASGITFRE
jgi:quercetin dioxygenase-like cupin family protein